MPLITRLDLSSIIIEKKLYESSADILLKGAAEFSVAKTYDIFISHSYSDADEILKIKQLIESFGFTTYVDWIVDMQLDRTKVTKETAALLRARMKQCLSLFYVSSTHSPASKWMPWELGYFDALKNRVAILPIAEQVTNSYQGQEYLGLYPYIDKYNSILFVNDGTGLFANLREWIAGKNPYKH